MTEAQIQSAVRQYRGSDPEHRQNLLSQLESIASRCPERATREQAIALLPHLQKAEAEIQAQEARVSDLARRVAQLEMAATVPANYPAATYTRRTISPAWVKGGAIVAAGWAVVAIVGIKTLFMVVAGGFLLMLLVSGLFSGNTPAEVREVGEGGQTATGGQMQINIVDNHGNIIINQYNGK
jgi:anti-sigma factor RsiW